MARRRGNSPPLAEVPPPVVVVPVVVPLVPGAHAAAMSPRLVIRRVTEQAPPWSVNS
jgi:hypothetical protein